MKYKRLVKVVVLLSTSGMLMSGCANDVVGRYKKCENQGKDCSKQIPEIAVGVVFLPAAAPPSSAPNGTDLPGVAQAAYIRSLAKKSSTAEELRKNLAAKISSGDGSPALHDQTIFGGTLIITVSDTGPFNPVDRLERTEVEIKFDNFNIRSWTAVKTAYTTVNAGTIHSNQLRGMELGVTSPSLPNIPGISAQANTQSTRDETLTASEQVEDVTPIFNPEEGSIRIIRHGGMGLNLTGNTILQATFAPKVTVTAFEELFSITTKDEKNQWLKPTKLKLKTLTSRVPRGLGGATATVTLTYTLRHVKEGGETIQDADDVVKLITKTVSNPPVLIPAESLQVETYGLMFRNIADASDRHNEMMISVRRPERNQDSLLCFDDYESAQDLLDYLKRPYSVNPDTVGTAKIGFEEAGNPDFTRLDLEMVKKLSVQPKCQPL